MREKHCVAIILLFLSCTENVNCWTISTPCMRRRHVTPLHGRQSRSTLDAETLTKIEEEETPAGVEGAQFFGGNKEKEDYFDPVAEAEAVVGTQETTIYDRFQDREAFPDNQAASLAVALQSQINSVLYQDDDDLIETFKYDPYLVWETSIQRKASTPLRELEKALEFYNRLDLAITSARTVQQNAVQLRWELSVAWPTFYEPRVLLTGTSDLTFRDNVITKQIDSLDLDLLANVGSQITPRFWDVYHIGMTPSTELSPKIPSKSPSLLPFYKLYALPPRLYLQPSQLDSGDREEANADTLPNHSFSCIIKTMGPQRQRYVTASPVEVQILPTAAGERVLQWKIPIAVEYMTKLKLQIPGPNEEAKPGSKPECRYKWEPQRHVATLDFGGGPQDEGVADVRKRLYERVVKDGLTPKLDQSGRPIFFFWQNGVKVCYTDEGLGMAVYEWRPNFVKPNAVGIELESQGS